MTARPVRWLLAVVASTVTFGLCLWAVSAVSARWLPEGEEARWGVLAAFAGVTAAAVGGAVGWWAAQDGADPSADRQRIDQEADVTDDGDVVQIAGDAGAGAPRSDGGPGAG
ncbi:hypothetical protein [Streptomyces sp. NPDC047315]|uniref:hypothetical protein n=1 Tax=Streptomyces sp. NPDC047315 TaxID=3155142 RepID=UPI0033D15DC7